MSIGKRIIKECGDMQNRRSRTTRIAVTISIVLHVIAFFALAWVRLCTNEDIGESEISVAFVQELKTKVMRRSLLVRPAISLDESTQRRLAGRQVIARPTHGASSDFYIADTSGEVFSEVVALGREVIQEVGAPRPSMSFRQNLVEPMTAELRESSPAPHIQTNGFLNELLADDTPALAKPDMRINTDDDSILREFFDAVRRKIEARKKYPASAWNAGIEGRAGVRMTILKNGQLGKVEIVDTSGREILDNAALQSVRDAAPFPPIPVEAGHDRIGMRIYLVFRTS